MLDYVYISRKDFYQTWQRFHQHMIPAGVIITLDVKTLLSGKAAFTQPFKNNSMSNRWLWTFITLKIKRKLYAVLALTEHPSQFHVHGSDYWKFFNSPTVIRLLLLLGMLLIIILMYLCICLGTNNIIMMAKDLFTCYMRPYFIS